MTASQFALSGLCTAAMLAARTPVGQEPRFATTTDVVPLYVTVTSGRGGFVTDLTVRDFSVFEDGKIRPISQFETGSQSVALSVLVDESPSASDARHRTEAAAREIIKHLRKGDLASIGAFSQSVSFSPDLTADSTELLKRVAALGPGAAGTALWDAVDVGITALDRAGGRRVVLVLTDGEDNSSFRHQAFVRDRIVKSGVMLYVIAVKGSDGRLSRPLRDMARETGGVFMELKANESVEPAIGQVMDELHHQYMLGFSPAQLDGRVHTLAVRVARRGVSVRSRTSYVADPR
jgi:VWFA-related protein